MQVSTIGVDLAKNVFQVHGVDSAGKVVITRQLRRKQVIERLPGTHRYRLTPPGRAIAVLFTKTYVRILNPSLAELDPTLPNEIAATHPLARHWRAYEQALDQRIADAVIMT